jgi:hypothetical protein
MVQANGMPKLVHQGDVVVVPRRETFRNMFGIDPDVVEPTKIGDVVVFQIGLGEGRIAGDVVLEISGRGIAPDVVQVRIVAEGDTDGRLLGRRIGVCVKFGLMTLSQAAMA